MGNVSLAIVKRNVVGGQRSVVADVTFSNSYATNGDTIVANDIKTLLPEGSNGLADLLFAEYQNDASGNFAVIDAANKKFKAFTVAGVEKTNASDQSALKVRMRFHYGGFSG